jgi:hypothetical protein
MTPAPQLRKEFIIEVTENFDYLLTETDVKEIADIADKVYTRESSDVLEELEKQKQIYKSSCHDAGDSGTIQGINIAIGIIKEFRHQTKEREQG